MRIEKVQICNFRSFKNTTVNFGDYTALVGPNGAGKSTVLCALNLFFRETENTTTDLASLGIEDFHNRDTSTPVVITVTFTDLNEDAQTQFADYFRNGKLIVTAKAEFENAANSAVVRQYGQRMGMIEFAPFFKAYNDGEKAGPLKEIYESLMADFPDLPKAGSKDANHSALRKYETEHPERCISIPSEDQFYGWSKGGNLLQKYVQWVYVPAVKDASKEDTEARNTALGNLLARTVRARVNFDEDIQKLRTETLQKYREIIAGQQEALATISGALQTRLAEWAHPEATARLCWQDDERKSVQVAEPVAHLVAGECGFEGEIARFGHGLQRCYLLALLQELATYDMEDAPRLILGCEEPELYQHPPQARHLAAVLERLSKANSQIVVTTHSPLFVTGRGFESVRLAARVAGQKESVVTQANFDQIAQRYAEVTGDQLNPISAQQAKLDQALNPVLNEMFFTSRLVLVEGIEDASYIYSWLVVTDRWDDFRARGCHIIPVGCKDRLITPTIIAHELGMLLHVVADADGHVANPKARVLHERDNRALLILAKSDDLNPFPADTYWGAEMTMWPTEIGQVLRKEAGEENWDKAFGKARTALGNPEGDFKKNPMAVGVLVSELHTMRIPLPSLGRLCDVILSF